MRDQVSVAAASVESHPGDPVGNLGRMEVLVRQATASGAELILFPELSLTGFIPNHPVGDHDQWLRLALPAARKTAQTLDGHAVHGLTELAARHDVLLCAGLLEDAGPVLHNTQVIVGPHGLLGAWRKMHVPMYEMPFYNGGGGPTVIDSPLGRLGVNICFDALIPESTRLLAVENVEIVLFPFAADPPPATPVGWRTWAAPPLIARCQENGVFGIACNYSGRVELAGASQTFPGGGLAVDPRGTIVAEWPAAERTSQLMHAVFHNDTLLAARSEPESLFRFRRPELYGPLASPPASADTSTS